MTVFRLFDIEEQIALLSDRADVRFRRALSELVEIAELAHRANIDVPCHACGDTDDCANARLKDALARIDFA